MKSLQVPIPDELMAELKAKAAFADKPLKTLVVEVLSAFALRPTK